MSDVRHKAFLTFLIPLAEAYVPQKNFLLCVFQCNVKCGQGLQHRNVICRDGHGHPSSACDFAVKPVTRQPCTGQICDGANEDVRQKKMADSLELESNDNQVTSGWMKLDSGILKPPQPRPSEAVADVIKANTEATIVENTTDIMTKAITEAMTTTTTTTPRIPSEPT